MYSGKRTFKPLCDIWWQKMALEQKNRLNTTTPRSAVNAIDGNDGVFLTFVDRFPVLSSSGQVRRLSLFWSHRLLPWDDTITTLPMLRVSRPVEYFSGNGPHAVICLPSTKEVLLLNIQLCDSTILPSYSEVSGSFVGQLLDRIECELQFLIYMFSFSISVGFVFIFPKNLVMNSWENPHT